MADSTTGVRALNALQGRWTVIYQEIDGHAVGPDRNAATIVELHENEFKIEQNKVVNYEGTFTIGGGSPADIVLIYRKSTNPLFLGGPRRGVFQVEGDTLKWNFGAVGHSGPKELNTYPGSESVLSVYQRETRTPALAAAAVNRSALRSVALW